MILFHCLLHRFSNFLIILEFYIRFLKFDNLNLLRLMRLRTIFLGSKVFSLRTATMRLHKKTVMFDISHHFKLSIFANYFSIKPPSSVILAALWNQDLALYQRFTSKIILLYFVFTFSEKWIIVIRFRRFHYCLLLITIQFFFCNLKIQLEFGLRRLSIQMVWNGSFERLQLGILDKACVFACDWGTFWW